MSGLHFRCDPSLFSVFPELNVFAVKVTGMTSALAKGDAKAILAKAIADCTVDPEKVPEDPYVAGWREAYGKMGVKPSKFRSSVEALLRRASKRAELALPVDSVNLYNACSIAHRAPLGAYDLSRLPAPLLELRRARPESDRFEPLGAEASAFPLTADLVVYGCEHHVLCWGFNSRDSRLSCLDENSDQGVFFAEAANALQRGAAAAALAMLSSHFNAWGASCSPILNASKDSPDIAF